MYRQIQEAMDKATIPSTSSHLTWVGECSRVEVPLTIKGHFKDKNFHFFDVDNDASQLSPSQEIVWHTSKLRELPLKWPNRVTRTLCLHLVGIHGINILHNGHHLVG